MPAGGLAPRADSFGRPRIPSDLNDEIRSTDRDWLPPMNSEGRWIWLVGSRCLARCLALPLQLLKAPMIEFLLEFPSGSSDIKARERSCGHPCPTPPPAAGSTGPPRRFRSLRVGTGVSTVPTADHAVHIVIGLFEFNPKSPSGCPLSV